MDFRPADQDHPGGKALLWFAGRREWRKLARALTATAVVSGLSYLLDPGLWREWVGLLLSAGGDDTSFISVRTLAAVAAVLVCATGNHARCLPLAIWLAAPVFSAEQQGHVHLHRAAAAGQRLRCLAIRASASR